MNTDEIKTRDLNTHTQRLELDRLGKMMLKSMAGVQRYVFG